MADRWATFDVYGTLIDWDDGIGRTLARLWPERETAALLRRYHEVEPVVERERPGASYREVLAGALRGIADKEGLELATAGESALADSLAEWAPFPDVKPALEELRSRGWRLAPLSNTDPDFLEASLGRIGVPVDEWVVASEIGSYKPAHEHWIEFFRRTGADRARHVHVAASLLPRHRSRERAGARVGLDQSARRRRRPAADARAARPVTPARRARRARRVSAPPGPP